MASFSLVHWLVVALVVLVLFGKGKISQTMGDFGQGIRSFRKGMTEDDSPAAEKLTPIAHDAPAGADRSARLSGDAGPHSTKS